MPTLINSISFLHEYLQKGKIMYFFPLCFFWDGNILKLILNAMKGNLSWEKKAPVATDLVIPFSTAAKI